MSIAVTQKLRNYLEDRNTPFVCVDIAEAKTCGGAIGEVVAFVPKGRRIQTAQEEAVRSFDCDGIAILFLKHAIRCDEEAVIDLRRFLGLADITVHGIHL